ncbi:MAG TPA: hypothetical protein VMR86_15955 [Myxococcota bacterium]|nr:hypothetical protein [Myxococcota bacterium]
MTAMLLRAIAVLLLLASCAGPVPHASGPAAQDYFPMLPGTHWVYKLHTGLFTSTKLDVTARGERPVRGSESGVFVVEERADAGEMFGLEPSGLVGYRVADGYVTRVPALELGSDGVVHLFGHDGFSILPLDPHPGQQWSDQVQVFDQSGSHQSWTASVESVGRMHVPAGTFDDVILVRSQHWDPEWRETEPLHSYEDYYARGVGLIRSVAHNHTRWLPIAELDQELVEVSFEGGTGGAVAR